MIPIFEKFHNTTNMAYNQRDDKKSKWIHFFSVLITFS